MTASLPTVDDVSAAFPPGSAIVPRKLCQKIAVVSENLVVGWAGGYDTARAVIGELRRLDVAQRFTNESLQRHLDSLNLSVWAENGDRGTSSLPMMDRISVAALRRISGELARACGGVSLVARPQLLQS